MILPDNKSVRLTTAATVRLMARSVTVSNGVKNTLGMANGGTLLSIMSGQMPLLISEVKVVSAWINMMNLLKCIIVPAGICTSTVKLHFINTTGAVDVNVPDMA